MQMGLVDFLRYFALLFKTTRFGLHVRLLRERQGLSQDELARKAGIDPHYLERLEAGAVYPRAAVLPSLAKALGVTVAELVE